MTEEPARNISGGQSGGGRSASFDAKADASSASPAERIVNRLGELYWQKTYGDRDAFECLIRTILSQNTSDAASQPAHDALMDRYDDGDLPSALTDADQSALAETISPAGLQNQKSKTIIRIATRVLEEYGDAEAFEEFVKTAAYDDVRDALLDMTGVGPKTADCVLLFAGGRGGVFPVDTHVHRIYRRLGIAPPDGDPDAVRAVLEAEIPEEKCGFGHTASIQFGREYCTARKPACLEGADACPLGDLCDRVGVNPNSGKVVDPSETIE